MLLQTTRAKREIVVWNAIKLNCASIRFFSHFCYGENGTVMDGRLVDIRSGEMKNESYIELYFDDGWSVIFNRYSR